MTSEPSNDLSDDEVAVLWAAEAKRRLEEIDSGQVTSIPAHEVAEKAEKLLRRSRKSI